MTENLEKFELGIAVQKLYDFIWDQFCDWYIELAKTRLQADGASADTARRVLVWVLTGTLRLLHPFMPFITEEIWQTMPHEGDSIMVAPYPVYDAALSFPEAEAEMKRVMDAIRAVRNRRAEMNVPPSKKAHVYIATALPQTFRDGEAFLKRLAYASDVTIGDSFDLPQAVTIVTDDARLYIPMDELVDKAAETARLLKEKEATQKQLAQVESKLQNPGFTEKAPAQIVEGARQNAQRLKERLSLIDSSLEALR